MPTCIQNNDTNIQSSQPPLQITRRSVTSGEVPDATTPDATMIAIDRFFDLLDSGVDRVDHVLGRGKKAAEKRPRRARGTEAVVVEVVSKPLPSKPRPTEPRMDGRALQPTALARRPRFYIVESVVSGSTQFVVTDGGNARTLCATRLFAEQILQALEKAP
jgi:hypothetical protein